MRKVIYIPLDERPCNYNFPYNIFNSDDFQVIRPSKMLLGNKKNPANVNDLRNWLLQEAKNASGLVISLDMLIYGGIVPSRLHHYDYRTLEKNVSVLKEIKSQNPEIIIYGFQLIMRCPTYNSADEEPPYYQNYGRDIFRCGYLKHRKDLNIITAKEERELESINIPEEFIYDFLHRRNTNVSLNILCLEYVEKGIIDFINIPQDDSSEYGWTAIDQVKVRDVIRKKQLMNKVFMYPGADEAGCTVMSRMFCHMNNMMPKVLIKYPSYTSSTIIPSIEDRYLDTMVKYHVLNCGGIVVTSLQECNTVLFINAPADKMLSSFERPKQGRGLTVLRNMPDSIEFIKYAYSKNKAIIIGDITYGNGSDLEIYQLLKASNLLFDVAAFAGWNTASNSIGCAIAQGFCYLKNHKTKQHYDFLISRFIEDIGYCGYTRQFIMKNVLPKTEYNYFNIGEADGLIANAVKEQMDKFLKENMNEIYKVSKINKLILPWRRMYEIDLDAEYVGTI